MALNQNLCTHGFEQDRIMCFDGRRQFVVSAPCRNCRRRQSVQETTICGVRFCQILHKLSSMTICAGTTICGATTLVTFPVMRHLKCILICFYLDINAQVYYVNMFYKAQFEAVENKTGQKHH